jgi:hypothetical protein
MLLTNPSEEAFSGSAWSKGGKLRAPYVNARLSRTPGIHPHQGERSCNQDVLERGADQFNGCVMQITPPSS